MIASQSMDAPAPPPGSDIGIDPELLAQAQRLGLSVAGLSETQLRLYLQKIDPAGAEARAKRWAAENAEAIAEHNERIAQRGLISDHFRRW